MRDFQSDLNLHRSLENLLRLYNEVFEDVGRGVSMSYARIFVGIVKFSAVSYLALDRIMENRVR